MDASGVVRLSLDTLARGEAVIQVDEKLEEVIQDVIERPHAKGARVVTLKITVKPKIDARDQLNYPEITCQVGATIPGTEMDESGIIREGQVYLSTARQMEIEQPENVEPLHGKKQGNGGE